MPNIFTSLRGIFIRILAGCSPGEALFLEYLTCGILSVCSDLFLNIFNMELQYGGYGEMAQKVIEGRQ